MVCVAIVWTLRVKVCVALVWALVVKVYVAIVWTLEVKVCVALVWTLGVKVCVLLLWTLRHVAVSAMLHFGQNTNPTTITMKILEHGADRKIIYEEQLNMNFTQLNTMIMKPFMAFFHMKPHFCKMHIN